MLSQSQISINSIHVIELTLKKNKIVHHLSPSTLLGRCYTIRCNLPTPAMDTMSVNAALAYPRTGKRGVPQQFARRLYEMLQSEADLTEASEDYEVLISWSASGLAFRIHDVDAFTTSVLPKYFRTKKFSSFQRNLNLVSHLVGGSRNA